MKFSIIAVIAAAALAGASSSTLAATITVKNNCGTQIAIGVYPAATYANGGAFLASGASVSFPSFPAGNGGRVWSRDNCVANGSGPDSCSSGQCGGTGIQCAGSTAAGVSEAEINFNASGTDYYDVSYVDGLNNATTIATSSGVSYGCSSKPSCPTVLNNGYGASGDSCQSPCTAAQENIAPWNSNTPLYCCTGSDGTSATCPLSSWTSSAASYVSGIHSDCPGEYAYAYDDNVGLHTIATGVSYTITFCGGGGNSTGSSSSSSSGGITGAHTLAPESVTGSRLDDNGGGTANGNKVDIWSYTSGNVNQQWTISTTGVVPAGDYNLAVKGPYCLGRSGSTSGSASYIWACNGTSGESWSITADSAPAGYYQIKSTGGLCLGVKGGDASTANGTVVDIETCNSNHSQQWDIEGL